MLLMPTHQDIATIPFMVVFYTFFLLKWGCRTKCTLNDGGLTEFSAINDCFLLFLSDMSLPSVTIVVCFFSVLWRLMLYDVD